MGIFVADTSLHKRRVETDVNHENLPKKLSELREKCEKYAQKIHTRYFDFSCIGFADKPHGFKAEQVIFRLTSLR